MTTQDMFLYGFIIIVVIVSIVGFLIAIRDDK